MQLLYEKENKDVRCVLLGTNIPLGKTGKYIERFFKDTYDIDVEYLEGVKTVPSERKQNNRLDQLITVKAKSVEKFNEIKSEVNAEYAIDIVRRGDHRLYNERTFLRYFQRLENQLRKSGEISEENIYQSLF